MKSILKLLGTLFLVFILFLGILFLVFFIYLKITLPSISQLKNYRPAQTNIVLDVNGNVIGYIGKQRRIFVPLEKIPPHVIKAFIAAEDANFYKHKGIDFLSVLRALYKNIIHGRIVQGASTITQQVVRALLLSPERTIQRKIKEMILAWQIEKYLTKDEILTIYLNHIYLGEGAYGVEAAALTYFNKHVWELDLNEAAIIAGLPPAPSRYSPLKNPKLAISRRNYVLRRMAEVGYISWDVAKYVSSQPLILNPKNVNIPVYTAYFIDAVKEELSQILPSKVVEQGGLKIQTTLDLEWIKRAYENAIRTLKKLFPKRELPEIAVACLNNEDGGVRLLIGGKDYRESSYNRAILAKRQPGSAFKPFIWATAIEDGILLPDSIIPDEPITLPGVDNGKDWSPRNYDNKYMGPVSLKDGLAYSRNTVSVRIALLTGLEKIQEMLEKLGFQFNKPINYSIALGTYEVTPLELTKAYTIFPNMGVLVKPHFIEKIYDSIYDRGRVIYQNVSENLPIISANTAYVMNNFMQAVVQYGTGVCAKALGVPVAGKTGTTQEYKDAWFIGYTPRYTCGVWVGYDKDKTLGRGGTGGRVACPIWLSIMQGTAHEYLEFPTYEPINDSFEEISNKNANSENGATSQNSEDNSWLFFNKF
jgi:penicillin-binding protein 1A